MKKIIFLIILLRVGLCGLCVTDPDFKTSPFFAGYTMQTHFQDETTGFNFSIRSIDPFEVFLIGSVPIGCWDHSQDDTWPYSSFYAGSYDGLPSNEYSGDVVIPYGYYNGSTVWQITGIAMGCFHQCTELTSVQLPPSLTEVRRGAFAGCTALTEVKAGADFHGIYNPTATLLPDIFKGCTALKKVDLRFAERVWYGIFRECPNLEEVHLYCFFNQANAFIGRTTPSLQKIHLYFPTNGNQTICGSSYDSQVFFDEEFQNTELIVPAGSLEQFKSHPLWGRFRNIREADEASVDAPEVNPEWMVVARGNGTFRVVGDFSSGGVYTLQGVKMCDISAEQPDFTVDRHEILVVNIDGASQKILF